jgi:hypothetical protein
MDGTVSMEALLSFDSSSWVERERVAVKKNAMYWGRHISKI